MFLLLICKLGRVTLQILYRTVLFLAVKNTLSRQILSKLGFSSTYSDPERLDEIKTMYCPESFAIFLLTPTPLYCMCRFFLKSGMEPLLLKMELILMLEKVVMLKKWHQELDSYQKH